MALNKTFHFFILIFLLTSCSSPNVEKEVPKLEVRNSFHSLKISICEGAGTRDCKKSGSIITVQDYVAMLDGIYFDFIRNKNIDLDLSQRNIFDDIINEILNDDFELDNLSHDAPTGRASIKIVIDNELVYYKTCFSSNPSSPKVKNLICFFAKLFEYECDDFYIIEKQW